MKVQPETQSLIEIAEQYRQDMPDLKGGYVIINNMKSVGWTQCIQNKANDYLPGTWVIDESGNKWLAIGGNDYDGAENWQMIPHDTFSHENNQ